MLRKWTGSIGKIERSYVVIKKYVENKSTLLEKLRSEAGHLSAGEHKDYLSPEEYVYLSEKCFKTPFFDSLKKFLVKHQRGMIPAISFRHSNSRSKRTALLSDPLIPRWHNPRLLLIRIYIAFRAVHPPASFPPLLS
jgi:hypothetical protein